MNDLSRLKMLSLKFHKLGTVEVVLQALESKVNFFSFLLGSAGLGGVYISIMSILALEATKTFMALKSFLYQARENLA